MRNLAALGVIALAMLMLGATGTSSIRIQDAWVRAMPPGAPTTAVYALIQNTADEADRLLAVETDAADAAELHTMAMEGGMMVMRPVEGSLEVPAKGTLQLKPGGYHIMLIRPKAQVRAGDRVTVTFVFEQAGRVTLSVAAKEGGAAMSGHGMSMDKPMAKPEQGNGDGAMQHGQTR